MQSSPRIEELRQKFHENPRRYFAPLANEYRKAGDPEQAIAICRAHLAQQPGHMSGHVVYGQALYDAGRIDEANTVFRQALALDPENMIVLRHLGDIARQRGEIDEARSWYSRALDGDPLDTEIAAYLAELAEPLVVGHPVPSAAPAPEPEPEPAPPVEVRDQTSIGEPAAVEEQTFDELVEAPSIEPVPAAPEPSFDTTFDELIVDEGLSEQATALQTDDSPYLDDASNLEVEESVGPAGSPEIEQSPDDMPFVEAATPTSTAFFEDPLRSEEAQTAEESSATESSEGEREKETPEEKEPEPSDRASRSTPTYESSPIITRTLAELYLEQGYIEPALEIYRQLAEREPHDEALQARITELSADAEEALVAPPADDVPARTTESIDGPVLEAESVVETGAEQEEPAAVSEPFTDIWDAPDSWGADMFEDIDDGSEMFGMTAMTKEDMKPAFAVESETSPVIEEPVALEREVDPADEEPVAGQPVMQHEPDTFPDEPRVEQLSASPEPAEEPGPEEAAPMEVPSRGITIREFFATLGSMRPPTVNGEDVFNPDEQEAEQSPPEEEQQYPYADDAFASLFQDAPVSPEDSRAAAALSSAVAHNPPPSSVATPAESRPASESDDSGAAGESLPESDEDIRRFREWLDGLASS